MKTCSKCGEVKEESDYFIKDKKIGRLHAQCKQCHQTYRQTYYAQHYAKYRESYLLRAKSRRKRLLEEFHCNLLAYLSDKGCIICGESDVRVLEFDHLEPTEKAFSISQSVHLGYSWEDTLSEIKKCRILCANCHKKHTASQFNWYKSL